MNVMMNPVPNTVTSSNYVGMSQQEFQLKYEINPIYMPILSNLYKYEVVIICDDSGSMRNLADPDTGSPSSRWDELKKAIEIIIEAHALYQTKCDIYFLNRGYILGVNHISQIANLLTDPPNGGTNIVSILELVQNKYVGTDMGKDLICHILTDGHPTNVAGNEDMPGLTNWLRNRKFINKTFYSIVLCTDDEDIERGYRSLEYNPYINTGIKNVDVTEDYRGELRDVKRARGRNYKFTYGDYIIKVLCGAYDKSVHQIDLPKCCCIII